MGIWSYFLSNDYWIYSMGEINNDTEYYDVIKKGNEMLDKDR